MCSCFPPPSCRSLARNYPPNPQGWQGREGGKADPRCAPFLRQGKRQCRKADANGHELEGMRFSEVNRMRNHGKSRRFAEDAILRYQGKGERQRQKKAKQVPRRKRFGMTSKKKQIPRRMLVASSSG